MSQKSICYVNSMGFMAQWKGEVISKDSESISIRFSKKKALKFNLKSLDCDFCLITNKVVKDLGVCISKTNEAIQFDDELKEKVLSQTIGNVDLVWVNGKWNS